MCLALSSKLRCSQKIFNSIQKTNDDIQIKLSEETYAMNQFYVDFYTQSMSNISHVLHPYFDGNKKNDSQKVKENIEEEICKVESIVND